MNNCEELDVKKRKVVEIMIQSNSSSSSATRHKKKKIKPQWMSGAATEEVGDSYELHLLCNSSEKAKNEFCANGKQENLSTASYMEKILGELREARRELFQWVRQEVQNMLCEEPDTPSAQNGTDMRLEEGSNRRPGVGTQLNSRAIRPQLGHFQGAVTSKVGFIGHGTEGKASCRGHYGDRESNLGKQSFYNAIPSANKNSMEHFGALVGQKTTPIEHVLGSNTSKCMSSRENIRESSEFFVGPQGRRVEFAGFRRETGGDGRASCSNQPNMQVGLGVQVGINGGMKYVQGNVGAETNFGSQFTAVENSSRKRPADFRTSAGPCDVSVSNSGVGPNQGSLLKAFLNEKTDFLGMPGMQNPMGLNIGQYPMQTGRNGCHTFGDFRNLKFNHNVHDKILNGDMCSYTGFIGNGTTVQSSSGMLPPGEMQSPNGILGVQASVSAENSFPSLSSSSLPVFIGMQNHVTMQDPSSNQNFPALGMNHVMVGASANRPIFSGMYLQQSIHQNLPFGKGTVPTSSEQRTGGGMQGMEMLELNA